MEYGLKWCMQHIIWHAEKNKHWLMPTQTLGILMSGLIEWNKPCLLHHNHSHQQCNGLTMLTLIGAKSMIYRRTGILGWCGSLMSGLIEWNKPCLPHHNHSHQQCNGLTLIGAKSMIYRRTGILGWCGSLMSGPVEIILAYHVIPFTPSVFKGTGSTSWYHTLIIKDNHRKDESRCQWR